MRVIQPVISRWEILCSNHPLLTRLYCQPYGLVVSREITLAGIGAQDRVLNIGCGAVPFSAILLAQLTSASVCAIDSDEKAVTHARRCVHRLGLSEQIAVECGSGQTYGAAHFSVALVALQAEPKRAILSHLLETSSPGSRFLFRTPSHRFRSHYDGLPSEPSPADYITQNMKTFDRTVLYRT